jgi:hypothetical protein
MNKLLIIFIYLFSLTSFGQSFYLKITGENDQQTKVIDSINYSNSFSNTKSIFEETKLFHEKLLKTGYLEQKLIENKKLNDSTFLYQYYIGKKTKFIHIYVGLNFDLKNWNLYELKKDTLIVPFSESEVFLNATLKNLETKGFAMSKVKLVNIKKFCII